MGVWEIPFVNRPGTYRCFRSEAVSTLKKKLLRDMQVDKVGIERSGFRPNLTNGRVIRDILRGKVNKEPKCRNYEKKDASQSWKGEEGAKAVFLEAPRKF
jgi:hypothetical protein